MTRLLTTTILALSFGAAAHAAPIQQAAPALPTEDLLLPVAEHAECEEEDMDDEGNCPEEDMDEDMDGEDADMDEDGEDDDEDGDDEDGEEEDGEEEESDG